MLIGGLEWNPAARFFTQIADLPVKQVEDENVEDGEVFEIEREGASGGSCRPSSRAIRRLG